jgi:type II secretory ATPase GspE/PulE/Tfp pilus assembly ATPase PilB-like protein
MTRTLCLLLVLAAVLLGPAADALAQDSASWPAYPLGGRDWRGPGYYLSWIKLVACWLVFVLWVWSADWVNRDVQAHNLGYLRWNPIVAGPLLGAMVLSWFLPWFWLALPLLLAAYAAPLAVYIVHRNGRLMPHQRVLTRDHLRFWLSERLAPLGIKIAAERPDPHETGPPIKLMARGNADPQKDAQRLLAARQMPGFTTARMILADALACRASAVMLDYTQQAVAVRYMVDGVWLPRDPIERQKGDPALEALKMLGSMNPVDRQNRQEGKFAADYKGTVLAATLATAGTQAGERAAIQFEEKEVRFTNFDELGMRPKTQEQLKQLVGGAKGLVLFTALPGGGLRSTFNIALRSTDRLMRDFVAVEEETQRGPEIENVPATTYKASAGETPADVLPKLLRTEPHVVVVRELPNAETVRLLCQAVEEGRLAIGTLRAKDCADAIARLAALGAPPAALARTLSGVLCQRLVRKLCETCKEAYAPTPEALKQLGIPPGKVQALHRRPQQPQEKVCPMCGGIGYFGRTAIFELLVVGDTTRKALAAGAKADVLRAAARKDGMHSLQEEGVLLVAKGVTDVQELARVLKQ